LRRLRALRGAKGGAKLPQSRQEGARRGAGRTTRADASVGGRVGSFDGEGAMSQSNRTAGNRRGAPRFRGLLVAGGYLGVGAALGALGVRVEAPLALKAMILLSEPVSSLIGEALSPWRAVALGLAVNAAALGYVAHSVARFGSRIDDMAALADRVLGRRNG